MSIHNMSVRPRRNSAMHETRLVGRSVECARLEQLLRHVRAGQSAGLVLRGGQGIGKTALLNYAARRADGYRIIRARGVESEMELPYAGLHLLCAPLLDGLGCLPAPQREALEAAIGVSAGTQPDRFLVSIATLTLLSDVARTQPLLCVIDDVQWLDRSSAQVLAFVIRRLEAAPIAFLFAQRLGGLDGLPELLLGGLSRADARTLLRSVIPGRVDESVVERIVAETHGNPLGLLELLRGLSPAELAGGFDVNTARQLPARVEESFLERVRQLPTDSRRLLLAAAAEPIGDPTLQWRAAAHLGIPPEAAEPLELEGLLSFGPRVTFCQPQLRSAIYRVASKKERRGVHRALAAATDPEYDPDRRAWHLAHATEGPDEEVAQELERCAARAHDRGGLAAAAAFLEKATLLTLDPELRVERALAAAAAKHEAGAPEAAVRLLATAELGPLDSVRRARLKRQRAQIAFTLERGNDAPELLLRAARELEPLEPELARETYLEALAAAIFAGRLSRCASNDIAEVIRAGVPAPQPLRPIDRLLDGLAARCTDGYSAAAVPLKRALVAFLDASAGDEATRWFWLAARVAADLWDDETWHALTISAVQLARHAGALAVLPHALTCRAIVDIHCGDFAAAATLAEEADAIAATTGNRPFRDTSLILAAWRGREDRAVELFETARQDACDRGEGVTLTMASFSAAVLYNGLGRYDKALAAIRDAGELDELGLLGWILAEHIEAAARTGQPDAAALALERLSERTRRSGTDWALGIEARSRALVSDGQAAEHLYLEAIERLTRSRVKVHLARAQLVYGEWLRRQGRRIDARVLLRAAREMFTTIGAEAFAERAHRELLATGEKARRRGDDTRTQLTPQEARIAFLARDGLTNPEIGARLFVSPRTVEYHLHKVFAKLGITSRTELHIVLPGSSARLVSVAAVSAPSELVQMTPRSRGGTGRGVTGSRLEHRRPLRAGQRADPPIAAG